VSQARPPAVDHNRLFAAADRLLTAFNAPGGGRTRVPIYMGSVPNGCNLPPGVFTDDEFYEAMAMLMRLGVVPNHTRPSPDAPG
jgi:hypothetical protein